MDDEKSENESKLSKANNEEDNNDEFVLDSSRKSRQDKRKAVGRNSKRISTPSKGFISLLYISQFHLMPLCVCACARAHVCE